ncbi:C3H1-type domain-containing protein [Fusarium sp. LHS14.1]|nr:C3H1-type domain-containing protein [Fusarium sp. LHS14.1]
MAVPTLHAGDDHDGDDEPQNHRSNKSDPYQIPMNDPIWGVRATRSLGLSSAMATLLAVQGYTVIPPGQPSSSHQPRILAPAVDRDGRIDFLQDLRTSLPNSTRSVSEHPAENGPQPDVAPRDEVQPSAAEASNGETSKTKRRSKKKKWEKNKKQEKKKEQEQEQKVCRVFQKSGQCRYGDKCKFSHQLDDTLPPPNNTADPVLPGEEDGSFKKEEDSLIELFFAKFPKFDYMRDKPLWDEFRRMVEHFEWQGAERGHFKSEFREALVEEFNYVYGTDEGSLESWGKLCQAMGLSVPTTLKEAHKTVGRAHVNLVALVQSPRTSEPVEVFKSVQDLRQFTAKTKWIFPLEHDQAGGLLKTLLRKMGSQSHGRGSRGKKKVVAK